jgi:hypothetical protein
MTKSKSISESKKQRASTDKRYRSKFYRRRYVQWKNSIRIGKTTSDQIENFISIFRAKSKNTGTGLTKHKRSALKL